MRHKLLSILIATVLDVISISVNRPSHSHYARQRATVQLWSHLLLRCTFIMEHCGIRSFTPHWKARFITHASFEMLIRISEPCFKSRTLCCARLSTLAKRRNRRGNTRRVSKAAALAATNDSPAAGTKINYLWIILRTHIFPPLLSYPLYLFLNDHNAYARIRFTYRDTPNFISVKCVPPSYFFYAI